ncbi:FAD:protein FMN transferase [Candidatus Wolfebacteria bacterium]|nr:FAD:protein FMN transferase [Candidatus Wolfebacteria bacterium]
MKENYEKIKSMGTDVEIFISTENKKLAEEKIKWLKKTLFYFENRFSRFIKNNELGKLNFSSSENFLASPTMTDILKKGQQFHKITKGVFDPTIITSLENFGYDKDFNDLEKNQEDNFDPAHKIMCGKKFEKGSFGEIIIDEEKRTIRKNGSFKIDLGGIGKGYIIDLLTGEFGKYFSDFWISAGGDMFLSGKNDGQNWQVNIQNPFDLKNNIATIIEIKNSRMAVATSGIVKRQWRKGKKLFHHLIDPKTGLPVENDILSATVIAPDAISADVFAKTVVIMGIKKGIDFINSQADVECFIIDKGMNFHLSKNMPLK